FFVRKLAYHAQHASLLHDADDQLVTAFIDACLFASDEAIGGANPSDLDGLLTAAVDALDWCDDRRAHVIRSAGDAFAFTGDPRILDSLVRACEGLVAVPGGPSNDDEYITEYLTFLGVGVRATTEALSRAGRGLAEVAGDQIAVRGLWSRLAFVVGAPDELEVR